MATKIPTEIVIKILNNIQSTQDLYSSLLVNRIWCKITIPILWKLPLGQEYCWWDDKKVRKKALCIRTYIKCMDNQTRTLLIQNGFDLSLPPSQATFDYPSFTHKFIINNLVYFISIYSQQIIGAYQDDKNNNNEITVTKSRILFCEICKLIINRCSFLDYFELAEVPGKFSQNFLNHSELISSILKLPEASKVFKKLESFTSMIRDYEPIFSLFESLKSICNNILNMDLKLNSHHQVGLLAKLISVQKYLENLSINANRNLDFNSIFLAIISQKETLKSLRLIQVRFNGKSSPIGQFISLQKLYIEDCSGLHKLDRLSWASSFTQLNSFHFRHRFHGFPQEFIIKILETANKNLRNIRLELYPTITFDTILAISNYCTNIIKLTLHNLRPEHVIAVFNNNFKELRRFSFGCEKGLDADKLLCQMAENIPESLETIKIRMGTFSADSLRKFFEGWRCKGGRENKKMMIVKRIGQARLFRLSDEHFKVIEEYGVAFKLIYLI